MAPSGSGSPSPFAAGPLASAAGGGAPTASIQPDRPTGWLPIVALGGLGLLLLAVVARPRRRQVGMARLSQLPGEAEQHRPAAYPGRAIPDDEANVPRWLRSSVRAGRSWRPQPVTQRMAVNVYRQTATFDEPAADILARMILRYDGVELLDEPNEAFARTVTVVGTGDEVDLLEVQGAWARVVTPRGSTGWLPSMTLRGSTTSEAAGDVPDAGHAPDAGDAADAASPAVTTTPPKPGRPRKRRAGAT